jgi:hypothetical protein
MTAFRPQRDIDVAGHTLTHEEPHSRQATNRHHFDVYDQLQPALLVTPWIAEQVERPGKSSYVGLLLLALVDGDSNVSP